MSETIRVNLNEPVERTIQIQIQNEYRSSNGGNVNISIATPIPTEFGLSLYKISEEKTLIRSYKYNGVYGPFYVYKHIITYKLIGTPLKTGNCTVSFKYLSSYVTPIYASSHMISGYDVKSKYKNYSTPVLVGISPISITTLSLPDGETSKPYSQQLEAVGTQPITWSIASGSLPPGLSLNPNTGIISGTPLSSQS